MFGDFAIRADQTEDPIRLVCVRGPDLGAVHQIVVALVFGLGLQSGQVGSMAWFRVTLTPANLAAGNFGQILQLLFLTGEFQQCRAEHPDAKALQGWARLDASQFFVEDLVLVGRQPAAAILRWPSRYRPAFLSHAFQPQLGLRINPLLSASAPDHFVLRGRCAHGSRTVVFQPGSGLFSKVR